MWTTFKKVIKDSTTENNSEFYCPFRIMGCGLSLLGVPSFLGMSIYSTIHTDHFDYMGFGATFCAMMTGMGVLAGGVALKAKTDT